MGTNRKTTPKDWMKDLITQQVETGTSQILDQFYAGADTSFSNSRSKTFLLMFGLERGDQLLCIPAHERKP